MNHPTKSLPSRAIAIYRNSLLTRRTMLADLATTLFLAGCVRHEAGSPETESAEPSPDPIFLQLSQALTGHHDIDPRTAARISQAFGKLSPDLKAHFGALAALSGRHATPAALLAGAASVGLADAALAIVAAWYTGTIGKGQKAISVAYVEALMQRPVADALAPPTYELGGPGWWIAEPPAVGLSPPVERRSANVPASSASHI